MVFNDTTNKSGIIQDCEFWLFSGNYGQISGSADLLNQFTALSNRALDSITNSILESDDRWEYDDTTYTDYPIATANLVNGQGDYVLSVSHLKVLRVEIQGPDGVWNLLTPIDLADMQVARDEYLSTPSTPIQYDILATSLFLYPKPNYDATGGLRVYFQREPNYFVNTDTTKAPGFVTTSHRLVSLKASYDFAVANNLTDKIKVLDTEIAKEDLKLRGFYGRRNKDEVLVMREVNRSYYPPSY